jgi:hypothetical protein
MPKNEELALKELQRRWTQMFSSLRRGDDVPPSLRLRTEGMMELSVMLSLASEEELRDALEHCYRDCYGDALDGDWRELFPFPQIPGFGQRAPVYPSTRD